MRADYIDITFILDRSGSMETVREDTIGGFNAMVRSQRALPGKATISLVQFDNEYAQVYVAKDLREAVELSRDTYVPRGSTALLDAAGRTINQTGDRLRNLPESERPGKAVFVIVTDGYENASREFSKEKVKALIEQQTRQWQWQFVYLGANVDAFGEASSMGMSAGVALGYLQNPIAVRSCYSSLTNNLASFRAGVTKDMAWTEEDRAAAQSS